MLLSYLQYGKILVLINTSGNQERLNLPMERVGIVRRISGPEKAPYYQGRLRWSPINITSGK